MTQPRSDTILTRLMSLHPKMIDLTLERLQGLLPKLGNPQLSLPPIIHVAGTNGKGSTQAMIRAGLEGAGKKVHAYTSPHLARFHERIRVAGELIPEDQLSDLLEECEAKNGGEPITFFEITTAAGLLAFSRTPADYLLLEVGLGGIWDATNVIERPALTVITPISLDHQSYLGDTVAEIAVSKAGIIKRGVPCVVGPQLAEALEVIEAKASRESAPLLVRGQHWMSWSERGRLIFQDENGLLDLPMPRLLGPHQVDNAGAAIMALRHLGFGAEACEAAMTGAEWPARMQRLKTGPLVEAAKGAELWLDGGHNPAGGAAVAATLAAMPARPTHLVTGMLNTKDVAGYMRPMAAEVASLTAVSIPDEINTLSAAQTAEAARSVGIETYEAPSVQAAIEAIIARAPNARILICGSLYLAGVVLRENG